MVIWEYAVAFSVNEIHNVHAGELCKYPSLFDDEIVVTQSMITFSPDMR